MGMCVYSGPSELIAHNCWYTNSGWCAHWQDHDMRLSWRGSSNMDRQRLCWSHIQEGRVSNFEMQLLDITRMSHKTKCSHYVLCTKTSCYALIGYVDPRYITVKFLTNHSWYVIITSKCWPRHHHLLCLKLCIRVGKKPTGFLGFYCFFGFSGAFIGFYCFMFILHTYM